jgi:hypothetical protein
VLITPVRPNFSSFRKNNLRFRKFEFATSWREKMFPSAGKTAAARDSLHSAASPAAEIARNIRLFSMLTKCSPSLKRGTLIAESPLVKQLHTKAGAVTYWG